MTGNSRLIIQEATSLGLQVEIISDKDHLFRISDGEKFILICELFSITLDPNCEAYRLSKNKDLTYALWDKAGIPFPKYYHFKNLDNFNERLPSLNLVFPLITKEGGGSKSINVHMDIRSKEQLEEAALTYSGKFIAQQMVTGKEYRLLMYKGRLLGALHMVPPHVVGDGVHTVQALINTTNLRKEKKIKITPGVLITLEKSGYTLESVLPLGDTLVLQKNSRLSEGGTSRDCTSEVHPDFIDLAWNAVKATNLGLGGIDLICSDISKSPQSQSPAFLEVNTYPDLTIHYFPTDGIPQPVAKHILADIFSK